MSDLSSIRPTLILKSSMNHKSLIHQEKQHQDIKRALINTSGISPLRTLLDGQTGRLQSDHCPNGPCSVAGQRSESEWARDGLAITVGGGAGVDLDLRLPTRRLGEETQEQVGEKEPLGPGRLCRCDPAL